MVQEGLPSTGPHYGRTNSCPGIGAQSFEVCVYVKGRQYPDYLPGSLLEGNDRISEVAVCVAPPHRPK